MKILNLLLLTLLFAALVVASSTDGDGCNDPEFGHLAKGENKTLPGKCVGVKCFEKDMIAYTHCPQYQLPESCEFGPEDLSKSFPYCCRQAICRDE